MAQPALVGMLDTIRQVAGPALADMLEIAMGIPGYKGHGSVHYQSVPEPRGAQLGSGAGSKSRAF